MKTLSERKIEQRCPICQEEIMLIKKKGRKRIYCSTKCKENNPLRKKKKAKTRIKTEDRKNSIPDKKKLPCLICGRWYIQVCLHAWKRHKVDEKTYKIRHRLALKISIIPAWYRNQKNKQFWNNPTLDNLSKSPQRQSNQSKRLRSE